MRAKFVFFGLVCLLSAPAAKAQPVSGQIFGLLTRPGTVFLTIDDAFDEYGPDGRIQTNEVAKILLPFGYPATFFIVPCHFRNLVSPTLPDPRSGVCRGYGNMPTFLLQELYEMGFTIGNHSFSHVAPKVMEAGALVTDIRLGQKYVEPFQKAFGAKYFRCPGFQCGQREADILNAQPDLAALKWIYADVGGFFKLEDGSFFGGDYAFYRTNRSAQEACRYYVRDIKNFSQFHGVVVSLHTRTEEMTGVDGSRNFPVDLLNCIIANLDSRYIFAPLDAIPGLLGNVQAGPITQWSEAFADGGQVVAGDIAGPGKAAVCQVRETKIWCMLPDADSLKTAAPKFLPPSIWLDYNLPEESQKLGAKLWLVDINHDGYADLVLPSGDGMGLLVCYSNGQDGFADPVPLLNFGTAVDYNGVAFGDVVGRDGFTDVAVWTPKAVVLFQNNGRGGFYPPTFASPDFPATEGWGLPQYLSSMSLADLNDDGCADLMMRGSGEVKVALSDCQYGFNYPQGWSYRLNDRQGWGDPSAYSTLRVVKIGGKIGLAGGLPTGIIFHEADPAKSRFFVYRYLNNTDYSNLPDWQPERLATGLVFGDFEGSGNDMPCMVRPQKGLYCGPIRSSKL